MTQFLGSESRKNKSNIASKLSVGNKDKERHDEGMSILVKTISERNRVHESLHVPDNDKGTTTE